LPESTTLATTLASPLAGRKVARMNGAGNKILVLDLRGADFVPTPEEARAIHRAPGLDYDQMMTLTDARTPGSAAYVLIYNNDGSLAGACGNGTRCVANLLCRELGVERLTVETDAGLIACERVGAATFRVDMGAPRLAWGDIPLARQVEDTRRVALPLTGAPPELAVAAVVNMGNPHAVFFVADAMAIDLAALGPRYETHPMFPQKANVTFAQVIGGDEILARVWERGVGVTLACGSAACATLVAATRLDLCECRARIRLPGGDLEIEWRQADAHVLMTGPVDFEREIALDASLFEGNEKVAAS
jgi:diaminopimelate epimerase